MATRERTKTTNGVLRKLGILALGASLTLAAWERARSFPARHDLGRPSVGTRDSENPYWSHNTTTPAPNGQPSTSLKPRPY